MDQRLRDTRAPGSTGAKDILPVLKRATQERRSGSLDKAMTSAHQALLLAQEAQLPSLIAGARVELALTKAPYRFPSAGKELHAREAALHHLLDGLVALQDGRRWCEIIEPNSFLYNSFKRSPELRGWKGWPDKKLYVYYDKSIHQVGKAKVADFIPGSRGVSNTYTSFSVPEDIRSDERWKKTAQKMYHSSYAVDICSHLGNLAKSINYNPGNISPRECDYYSKLVLNIVRDPSEAIPRNADMRKAAIACYQMALRTAKDCSQSNAPVVDLAVVLSHLGLAALGAPYQDEQGKPLSNKFRLEEADRLAHLLPASTPNNKVKSDVKHALNYFLFQGVEQDSNLLFKQSKTMAVALSEFFGEEQTEVHSEVSPVWRSQRGVGDKTEATSSGTLPKVPIGSRSFAEKANQLRKRESPSEETPPIALPFFHTRDDRAHFHQNAVERSSTGKILHDSTILKFAAGGGNLPLDGTGESRKVHLQDACSANGCAWIVVTDPQNRAMSVYDLPGNPANDDLVRGLKQAYDSAKAAQKACVIGITEAPFSLTFGSSRDALSPRTWKFRSQPYPEKPPPPIEPFGSANLLKMPPMKASTVSPSAEKTERKQNPEIANWLEEHDRALLRSVSPGGTLSIPWERIGTCDTMTTSQDPRVVAILKMKEAAIKTQQEDCVLRRSLEGTWEFKTLRPRVQMPQNGAWVDFEKDKKLPLSDGKYSESFLMGRGEPIPQPGEEKNKPFDDDDILRLRVGVRERKTISYYVPKEYREPGDPQIQPVWESCIKSGKNVSLTMNDTLEISEHLNWGKLASPQQAAQPIPYAKKSDDSRASTKDPADGDGWQVVGSSKKAGGTNRGKGGARGSQGR